MALPRLDYKDWMILLFMAVLFSGLSVFLHRALVDDAFIYLRVAENLSQGNGWVYNQGLRVNTTTAPLYTLILSFFILLGMSGPAALVTAYTAGLAGMAVVQYAAFFPVNRMLGLIMAFVTSLEPVLLKSAGIEMPIFLSIVLLAAMFFQQRRLKSAGVVCGLACLLRPEGIVLIPLILLVEFFRSGRFLLKPLLIVFICALPWLLFSWLYFGSVVPNSVEVKMAQSTLPIVQEHKWLQGFLDQMYYPFLTLPLAGLGMVFIITTSVFRNIRDYVFVVASFGIIQWGVYWMMKAPPGYFWYFAPGNLMVNMLAVLAIFGLLRLVWIKMSELFRDNSLDNERLFLNKVLFNLCLGAAILLFCSQASAKPFQLPSRYRLSDDYKNVGLWIKTNTPPHFTVACGEIGYIGYYSKRRIRDIYGLLHQESIPYILRQSWTWWYEKDTPEVIVTHKEPWPGEPSRRWWSDSLYEEFKSSYSIKYSSRWCLVYLEHNAWQGIDH